MPNRNNELGLLVLGGLINSFLINDVDFVMVNNLERDDNASTLRLDAVNFRYLVALLHFYCVRLNNLTFHSVFMITFFFTLPHSCCCSNCLIS